MSTKSQKTRLGSMTPNFKKRVNICLEIETNRSNFMRCFSCVCNITLCTFHDTLKTLKKTPSIYKVLGKRLNIPNLFVLLFTFFRHHYIPTQMDVGTFDSKKRSQWIMQYCSRICQRRYHKLLYVWKLASDTWPKGFVWSCHEHGTLNSRSPTLAV